jgi:hypothetical protein
MNTTKTTTKQKNINQELIMSKRKRNHAMKTPSGSGLSKPIRRRPNREVQI